MPTEYPHTIKVIEIKEAGAPEVLVSGERPCPELAAGEVLIEVSAAGVNRPDVMQRKGLYPAPPGASDIPGLEVAGKIVALGEGVSTLSVGDNVCALISGGGYASHCVAPAELCLPVPEGLSMEEAAALPETAFTVWTNVFERGQLTKGDCFLVHGGTSGIGTTAIQLAKAYGATVIATAGSEEKCQVCRDLGADLAINYKEEDFVAVIKDFTKGKGVNVILDMIAGDYFQRNLDVMAVEGRLVQIAVQGGPKTKVNVLPIMLKRLVVTGSTLRARELSEKARIAEELKEKVWPLIVSGTVRPIMYQSFSLEQAAAAHELMESSQHIGKIVLKV